MVNEYSFETGRIFVLGGSRQVLVKVLDFHLCRRGDPKDDTTPTFFHDSRSSLLVLSSDISFVSEFFWKGYENLRCFNSGPIYMEDPVCTLH